MGSMKSKRCRNGARKGPSEATQFDSCSVFEALLSAIQSPEGVSPAILKRLYFVLNHLCSNPQCRMSNGVDKFHLDMEIHSDWIKMTTKDVERLSDVLFQELSKRFKDFFDTLCNDSSDKDLGSAMWGAAEIVNLLLRCSLVVLTLLQHQQKVVLEKGQVILGILQSLSSVSLNVRKSRRGRKGIRFEKSVSVACEYSDSDCTTSTDDFIASLHFLEPSDSRLPVVSAMLEVFLDELLVYGQLRPLFMMFDFLGATSGMLHSTHPGQDDIGHLMEIISSHFHLTFSDNHSVEDFLDRLFWIHRKEFRYSLRAIELSPTAAILLLLNPILLSAPKFMLAHVIALISEAISNVMDFKNLKPDCRFMNCFLSVFEKSVLLYKSNMVIWQIDGNCRSPKGSNKSNKHGDMGQPSFDSFVLPDTRKKINYLITKLDGSSDSCLRNLSNKMKYDLMSSSIRYIKECQHIFDQSCQDEMLSILSCIVQRASDGFNDAESQAIEVGDLEDLCILASVLKLMSNSLLPVIWCLRHSGDLHCLESSKEFSSCKEYEFVLSTISCFTEFKTPFAIQKWLRNSIETNCTRHSNSKMMFLHFAGLFSFAFSTGLDFLVKGCLLNMIMLMNLFVFEEGNLHALHSLLSSSSESIASELPSVNIQEALAGQKSSLMVASKIQKMRTLYSSTSSLANHFTRLADGYPETGENALVLDTMAGVVGTEEVIEESSNGEVFLRCVLSNSEKVSDFDDLANFIECKQGKDYSSWLKDREKYRKWKGEKMAVLRWKRKKKTWRVVKGKKA